MINTSDSLPHGDEKPTTDVRREPTGKPGWSLSAKAQARRRRLSVVASLLGLGSVALALTVVVTNLLENREAATRRYLQTTKVEVRMLSYAVDQGKNESDDRLLNSLWGTWIQANNWAQHPDEHFLVIDKVTWEVILDSAYDQPPHRPPSTISYRPLLVSVSEQMGATLYNGPLMTDSAEPMLGSFLKVSEFNNDLGRKWLLGVYRSQAGLRASEVTFTSYGMLIAACGLAMPLSLLLMFYTYQRAQRDQARTEEARSRLAAIVQSSDDAIYSETFDGVITSWNRGAQQLFGYSETEAIGRVSAKLIPAELPAEEREIIAKFSQGIPAGENSLESIRSRKDGCTIHVSQAISPVEDARGRQVGVSIIARDISVRKNLERELLEITGREQQRIGRELHDSLGQELTGVSYLAKSLAQKLIAAGSPLGETAQTIITGIQQALREVRSAVQGLVPVEVDASGFMVALEKLCADTQSRCGIDCRIESSEPVQIDDNLVATHLYRIIQEAINNAVKHAQAGRIVVRPESRDGTLAVTVEDDGVGIANPGAQNGGMGLGIMRYRAGVINAALDVRTTDGKGTAVICLVKNKRENAS